MESKIQWTNKTQNFWSGCHKISAGCTNCYMFRLKEEWNQNPSVINKCSISNFNAPLRWAPSAIFTCSMSDFFIEEADKWRGDAWDVIRKTPYHRWQILTKRPDRILANLPSDWGSGWKHVALGVTVENQRAMNRVHTLATIPSFVKFISAEPLLENVNFLEQDKNGLRSIEEFNWVILGGESGNETGKYGYRPTELAWLERAITDLRSNSNAGIFVKQLGTYQKHQLGLKDCHGGDINEFPKHLRIREKPFLIRERV